MATLQAHGLNFTFSNGHALLHDVNFHLTHGWYGVVGANGCGKSTLLQLMAGTRAPTSGQIDCCPDLPHVAFCTQVQILPDASMYAFAAAEDKTARRLRHHLQLDMTPLIGWSRLSPGEQKRWQIGAALAAEPDMLLLDEPTNHLDTVARALLAQALSRFRGLGVLVSHDRALLAQLTHATLRVHQGSVRQYPGAYDAARALWDAEATQTAAAWRHKKDVHAALSAQVHEKRQVQAATQLSRGTTARMRNAGDKEARGMMQKNVAEWADRGAGRAVKLLDRQRERAAAQLEPFVADKTVGRSFYMHYSRAAAPVLLRLQCAALQAGERVLLHDVSVAVSRQARIGIVGPNGSGKTTLLRALLASNTHGEQVVHVPQTLTSDATMRLMQAVRDLPPEPRGRTLAMVAALGVDPAQLLASAAPSPGEVQKLQIAQALGRHVWGLVLDEPTNHLDLPSIERLEQALAQFPGALVIVCHDAAFLGRCDLRALWRLQTKHVVVE